MSVAPAFTVIVATFGRGAAIAPTLRSIAAQTYRDFEVLVVSDGPAAAQLVETVAGFDERFVLLETAVRSTSQSGPNNHGTARAQGRWVAFLGHDDLWAPRHLADLAQRFEERPDAHFVVGGCLFLGPPGGEDERTWFSGLFDGDDPAIATEHFFPPSSLAHVRELPPEVGGWPAPGSVRCRSTRRSRWRPWRRAACSSRPVR
jgi:glycosyltransferase involved in cell wall biosynthesis